MKNGVMMSSFKRVRALFSSAVLVVLLAVLALPSNAASVIIPTVNNFATAQFKILSTTQLEGFSSVAYGGGTIVSPDRTAVWLREDLTGLYIELIQIGADIYVNEGEGWEQVSESPIDVEVQPISVQLELLQKSADKVVKIGSASVGDVATTQYQIWVSGEKLLETSGIDINEIPADQRDLLLGMQAKYDLWIGDNDGFLHQQLTTVILPEFEVEGITIPSITSETLTTYFDFNNPNLSVNAPN
jgi:hypothetical protein